MTTVLVWAWGLAWLALAAVCMWPWVNRWFESPGLEWKLMRWPLTVGLSLGGLTLWMLVVGFWQLNAFLVLLFPAMAFAPAVAGFARPALQPPLARGGILPGAFGVMWTSLARADLRAWAAVVLSAIGAVVLGQATYYPFIGDDEISRYAYYARLVFESGQIAETVRGYPMFMPLAYAFVFITTGQIAEQLARLIPVLLSGATVMATAGLAARWYGARAGWGAAFLLAATPLYMRWSPDGYIDIPSALFFVLCAYAADIWMEGRAWRWAVLAGALAGLALWTKQAGFAALASLGVVFAQAVVAEWAGRRRAEGAKAVCAGLLALAAAVLVGGLWYVRNAWYDGWAGAVPGPGEFYYQLANRNPLWLVPFASSAEFGWLASLGYLAGLAWGAVKLRPAARPLLWAAPYTVLWWWLFSYDARFLLTVLPFYAILSGALLAGLRWPSGAGMRWLAVAAVCVLGVAGILEARLGGLRQWLVAPTATYAERLTRAKGALYPTAEFVRSSLPADARILSMDGRLAYYLIDRDMVTFYPVTLAHLVPFDYFIVGSWWESAYAGLGETESAVARAIDNPAVMQQVYAGPGYGLVVYRLVK